MSRRRFLSIGALSVIGPSFSVSLDAASVRANEIRFGDAYYLWYNSPNVAPLRNGFCIGYLTSAGEVRVVEVSHEFAVVGVTTLHQHADPSDHGSPSVVRIPSGPYAGHLLACFSNHATELYCSRSRLPDRSGEWEPVHVVDSGRCTYPSLAALPDGKVMLTYTIQHSVPGKGEPGEWRQSVCTTSANAGESWDAPTIIAGHGPGTFPYSTPVAISTAGKCAAAYSVYSSARKSHAGIRIVVSADRFRTVSEYSLPERWSRDRVEVIPYQSRWVSEGRLLVSFSVRHAESAQCDVMIATLSFDRRGAARTAIVPIAKAPVHGYTWGAAFSSDGSSLVLARHGGGLVKLRIADGRRTVVRRGGHLASPYLFRSGGAEYLLVMDDPRVRSTRAWRSSLLVSRLP